MLGRAGHGVYRITEDGECLVKDGCSGIDLNLLMQFSAYRAWRINSGSPVPQVDSIDTPEEVLDRFSTDLREALESDVLERIQSAPPEFLERVIIDLLTAIGYGKGDPSRGVVTGGPSDGGFDGKIKEDALGLDDVYVQAKRYQDQSGVSVGAVRSFAGVINAEGAKGVSVTTSYFLKKAKEFVAKSPQRIVLIDGRELARLLVVHGVGVRQKACYVIHEIDAHYFDPDD